MLNGDGLRVVLWVSGCTHKCKNCQNPETHDPNSGILFDESAKIEIFNELKKSYISGLTISGGDPLHTKNRECLTALVKEVKEKFPNKTIWMYTGYKYETVKELKLLNHIDILIDGPFIDELKDNSLHWKGSSNQRTIDVKKSLKYNKVVTVDK